MNFIKQLLLTSAIILSVILSCNYGLKLQAEAEYMSFPTSFTTPSDEQVEIWQADDLRLEKARVKLYLNNK